MITNQIHLIYQSLPENLFNIPNFMSSDGTNERFKPTM